MKYKNGGKIMFCAECGEEVKKDSNFCDSCGAKINKEADNISLGENNNSSTNNFDNNSANVTSSNWNWFGFLFGPLWYLYKGMIKKGIIIFIIGTIAATIVPGVGAVAVWIYCGLKGNEDLKKHLES